MEEDYQKFKQKQVLSQESDQTQTTLLELTKLIADLEKQIELVKLESGQEAEKRQKPKTPRTVTRTIGWFSSRRKAAYRTIIAY